LQQLASKTKQNFLGICRLARALPAFFRARTTVAQAEEEIKTVLERRTETFLELARARIYANPESPYLRLLKLAGCEFSDLRSHVLAHGLEATLERLAREGVYLTADEFKGKKDVVRRGESFRASLADFRRPDPTPGFVAQSSGSSNLPTRSFVSLDWIAMRSYPVCIAFSAHELFSSSFAFYDAVLPGSGGVQSLLAYSKLGIRIDRWFARQVPVYGRLQKAHHLSVTYLIVIASRCFGVAIPKPELIDSSNMRRIVRWALQQQAGGRQCCIDTVASSAVRIALAASEMGESLDGVKFIVHGEPFTESKRETIERSGASFTLRYSFSPAFFVGTGCAHPVHNDEVHVNRHLLAVTRQGFPLENPYAPSDALLFTTLHPLAPQLLLNVQNGDSAALEERDCGCALEKAGLTLHLYNIRSYEKFTSEGMNYFYAGLLELIEKILPAEFGGGPGDYQLVEEEDENGQTRLTLRVHPEVGEIDQQKLLLRLRAELGRGSWSHEFQTRIWEGAGTLRVKREAPFASSRGKILPLEIRKRSE
jgi:hypothetical protein